MEKKKEKGEKKTVTVMRWFNRVRIDRYRRKCRNRQIVLGKGERVVMEKGVWAHEKNEESIIIKREFIGLKQMSD